MAPPTDPPDAVPLGSLRDAPNAITAARLVVTGACFGALSFGAYGWGLGLFLLAAGTDWADGYWARRWGPITRLGRVLDPLADKLLVGGVFIYLAATPDSGVLAWVAVVVVARELVVTALRSFIEAGGGDFSAKQLGKLKMVAQCAAAVLCLYSLADPDVMVGYGQYARWREVSVITAVALTVWSGVDYAVAAARSMQAASDTAKIPSADGEEGGHGA